MKLNFKNEGCVACNANQTESHHAFFGSCQRQISDRMGFTCKLCVKHHRSQPEGVHGGNSELDLLIKQYFQADYEARFGRDRWMELIGRNYL